MGWLKPDGTFYPCEWAEHHFAARVLTREFCPVPPDGTQPDDWLLTQGWILIGSSVSYSRFIHWEPATQRQMDAIWDYCEVHKIEMPELD